MPDPARERQIPQLLEALAVAEYFMWKYRTRGDARADQGNDRSSTDYHRMAAEQSRKARETAATLTELLGPDGGSGAIVTGLLAEATRQAPLLAQVATDASFDDACFYMRHPRWAERCDRYVAAHARWAGSPVLEALAPAFVPIHDSWTD